MIALVAIVLAQTCESSGEFVCRSAEQAIGGHKTFTSMSLHTASYPVGGSYVGVYSPAGVATRTIIAPEAGQFVLLKGRRFASDTGGQVIVDGEGLPRGGYQFVVNSCGVMGFGVTDNNDIHFGEGRGPNCQSDLGRGALVHTSRGSGAPAVVRVDDFPLLFKGALGSRNSAWEVSGARPACDAGYPASWLGVDPDGGCYFAHASGHANVELGAVHPMRAGLLSCLSNPLSGTGAYTDYVWCVDHLGGLSQGGALCLADFPDPHEFMIWVREDYGAGSVGQFREGPRPSTMMYDHCGKHWYYTNGTEWLRLVDSADLALVNARLTALEATCP